MLLKQHCSITLATAQQGKSAQITPCLMLKKPVKCRKNLNGQVDEQLFGLSN